MVQGLAARLGGLDENTQVGAELGLADEVFQGLRAEGQFACRILLAGVLGTDHACVVHSASSRRPALIKASRLASSPSSRLAEATAVKASLRL